MKKGVSVNTGCIPNWGNMIGILLQIAQFVVLVVCMVEVTGGEVVSVNQFKWVQGAICVACVPWLLAILLSPKFSTLDQRSCYLYEWWIFFSFTSLVTVLWWDFDNRFEFGDWDNRHSSVLGEVNTFKQTHYYNILTATIFFWPWLPLLHFKSLQCNSNNKMRASAFLTQQNKQS